MTNKVIKVMVGVDSCIPSLQDWHQAFPGVVFSIGNTPDEQRKHIRDADVCIGAITRDTFLAARQIKWVASPWAGIDFAMAIPELVNSDVIITHTPYVHASSMADHVFAMMLSFAHCLPQVLDDQKNRRFDTQKYHNRILELAGSTIGILGFGAVGRAVARRADGFDMKICAIARTPPTHSNQEQVIWAPDRLDDLLKISDWFVISSPLTGETQGLIDKRRIALLKPSAHLIVISRGAIIDEEALAHALRSGQLAGAATDALTIEPPDPQKPSPLWNLDNCLISPHSSSPTAKMFAARRAFCKANLRRYLNGKSLMGICDKTLGY
ncbi:MAG: hydroxyacid dehydrogenase [Phycisphaeraceae bacterium]|nr:hydroxyacid dehydrogenase [Phycisphaeraceae bacterium]